MNIARIFVFHQRTNSLLKCHKSDLFWCIINFVHISWVLFSLLEKRIFYALIFLLWLFWGETEFFLSSSSSLSSTHHCRTVSKRERLLVSTIFDIIAGYVTNAMKNGKRVYRPPANILLNIKSWINKRMTHVRRHVNKTK